MKKTINGIYERRYKNSGQEAERVYSLEFCGIDRKADNKPFWAGADVGVIQIKTSAATVCKGTDIYKHMSQDVAEYYCYVLKDLTACYIMHPLTWARFVSLFSYKTVDSTGARGDRGGSNGGGIKLKLYGETKKMREWLECYGCDDIGMEE